MDIFKLSDFKKHNIVLYFYPQDDTPVCTQEAEITGMLKKVIRVLITGYFDAKPIPVYANGAEVLRPDLAK